MDDMMMARMHAMHKMKAPHIYILASVSLSPISLLFHKIVGGCSKRSKHVGWRCKEKGSVLYIRLKGAN